MKEMNGLVVVDAEREAVSTLSEAAWLEEETREKSQRYKREWEERYSSLLVGRRHWKIIAFVLVAINAAGAYGYWQLARSSRTELYVVERSGSQISYAGEVKPSSMDDDTWDVVKVEQLKKFITSWRTVTSDAVAQKADWDRSFSFLGDGSQARETVAQWYETNDPLVRANKGEIVTVQFNTFDREGGNTYGLWWSETTTALSGQSVTTKMFHARIVYATKIPSNKQARADNPMGILATELTVNEVQQ
jgi:type IV secretory pathway TrbF-like protein